MRKPSAVAVALSVLALGAAVALVRLQCADVPEAPPTTTDARSESRPLPGPGVPSPPPSGALSVRGRVVDAKGRPVAGVQVSATQTLPGESLSRLPCGEDSPQLPLTSSYCGAPAELLQEFIAQERGGAPVLAQATTGADGTFLLDALPEGAVALWALGASGSTLEPDVATGREDVELVLEEGLRFEGRVVAESGAPIPGAKVTLFHQGHSRYFPTSTGADGRFTSGSLPEGNYGLVASSPGLMPAYVPDVRLEDLEAVILHKPRRLTGRVLLTDGTPAPGAEVRMQASEQVVVTDAEGRFSLGALAPGDYEVLAERGGQQGFAEVVIAEEGGDVEATVYLGTLFDAEGVVLDEAGQPIAGATVTATSEVDGPGFEDATTGPEGRFRLGPLPRGSHVFNVDADGYRELESGDVQVSDASPPLTFTLVRAYVLAGTVTDPEGRPLPGIDVEALRPAPRAPRAASREVPTYERNVALEAEEAGSTELLDTVTDEEGRFLIEVPEPGRYTLTASSENFIQTRLEADAPGSGLRVVLRGGATLEGMVADARGTPLMEVQLTVRLGTDAHGQTLETLSDEHGGFTLGGLPPGTHVLRATLDVGGFLHQASRTVSVRGTETVDASLRIDTGKVVSGIVVDGTGRPVPDAEVDAFTLREQLEDNEGSRPSTTTTGPDGRFTVQHLPEGECALRASKPGHTFEEPAPGGTQRRPGVVARAGASDVRLVLRYQGYVLGRVVHRDGTPVARFSVNHESFRSPDGAFRLPMESAGTTQLRFDAPGLTLAVREVEVPPGQDLDLGDVRLEPGRQVRGRVVDAVTSQPVSRALLRVNILKDGAGMARRVPLDLVHTTADGSFTLPRLESRPMELDVMHDSYPHVRQPLGMDDEVLEIRLPPGAKVEGTVRDREGRPVLTEVFLSPLGPRSDSPRGIIRDNYTLGAEVTGGRFHFEGVPDGDYMVSTREATGPDGRRVEFLRQRVRIPPLGQVTLTLTERTGSASLRLRVRPDVPEREEDSALVLGAVSPTATLEELQALIFRQDFPLAGASPEGTWLYDRLPAGRFTYLVLSELPSGQFEVHREELSVSEGEHLVREVVPVWRPVPGSRGGPGPR